ncbi:threonine synthase [Candidatus Bathyarchaeota archaeon]|nr:threonine synthase [Candidatus Bathyarchaeota archaeon]
MPTGRFGSALKMVCGICGEEHEIWEMVYRCGRCDYPLEVVYDYNEALEEIEKEGFKGSGVWRYRALLPISNPDHIITLREGGTPLIRARRLGRELGLEELYIKDETRNPTWSFKDRGSAVGVSMALEVGARAVGCVSSGNMAASLASYAARGGLRCIVLIPRGTPLGKVAQTLICGAEVAEVDAPYPEICRMALRFGGGLGVYMVHNDAPMRVEGQKTISLEAAEELGWRVPDWILVPTSSAGNFSAVWKGWRELREMGLIDGLPRMGLVQAEGNAPIVRSYIRGLEYVEPNPEPKTIAPAIANPDPPSGRRALRILRASGGHAEMASDAEILHAQRLLASTEGIFAEPAGAVPAACARRMLEGGIIDRDDMVVLVVTGAGVKDVEASLKSCGSPVELHSPEEIGAFLEACLGREQ